MQSPAIMTKKREDSFFFLFSPRENAFRMGLQSFGL